MYPKDESISGDVTNITSLTCGLYYKTFRIVIYDRNDTSQYYKTTIVDYDHS
jgi:hypothetical protein